MRGVLLSAAVASLLAAPALAQQFRNEPTQAPFFREGAAPVIAPAAAETPSFNEPVKAFGEHYRSAGRPRIALFWNVALADVVANEKVKQSTTVGTSSKSGPINATETQREFEVDTTRRHMSSITEADAWRIESGFIARMSQAGVQFVDRATMLRLTQAKEGESGNVRLVEAKALAAMADLLLEVLSTRDAQAPGGYGFRVTLRDLKTGQQRAAFYSQAVPEVPAPERRYVAGPSGFVPAPQPAVTIDEVGGALALDTMREFVGRLR